MNEIAVEGEILIEDKIYEIRGKQVMLDSDLAKLYKCKNGTKTINQAVNRHLDRFPEDFYFQLTNIEFMNLQSQAGTTNISTMTRTLPYVFTEQGVAMLATILRTNVATQVSIDIMRAFVMMRQYIGKNEYRILNIETKILEHDKNIKLLQKVFDKFEEKRKDNEIYFNGQIFDAYYKIYEIFNTAKSSLIIIDNYADNTILDIIKRLSIKVTIITKPNNLLTKQDIAKYNKQYHNLKVVFNDTFHDRYFIIDNHIVYHCGTSINRIGYKTFSINLIKDICVLNALINKVMAVI